MVYTMFFLLLINTVILIVQFITTDVHHSVAIAVNGFVSSLLQTMELWIDQQFSFVFHKKSQSRRQAS
jgi:hypothetical protein